MEFYIVFFQMGREPMHKLIVLTLIQNFDVNSLCTFYEQEFIIEFLLGSFNIVLQLMSIKEMPVNACYLYRSFFFNKLYTFYLDIYC